MPGLSAKVGPLPVWGWASLALVAAWWVRSRQKAAAAQLPVQSLNKDYGPGGWPGQGYLGPIPISAISATAFQPPTTQGAGYGTMPGTSTPYPYAGGAGNPLNREAGTLANNPTAPFLPR